MISEGWVGHTCFAKSSPKAAEPSNAAQSPSLPGGAADDHKRARLKSR
jgi:hypothetical protein